MSTERSPLSQELFDLKVQQYFVRNHPEQVFIYGSETTISHMVREIDEQILSLEAIQLFSSQQV